MGNGVDVRFIREGELDKSVLVSGGSAGPGFARLGFSNLKFATKNH